MPRNFATLWPLELQPVLNDRFISSLTRRQILYFIIFTLQYPKFLVYSRFLNFAEFLINNYNLSIFKLSWVGIWQIISVLSQIIYDMITIVIIILLISVSSSFLIILKLLSLLDLFYFIYFIKIAIIKFNSITINKK